MSNPLKSLLYPKSIALAGATNNPTKMGMLPCLSILRGGYNGRFFPISRSEENILGTKAYKTVKELPEVPDLGIIIVPTEYVIDLVEDFGSFGTKNLIIVSAGFREMGEDGLSLEKKLKETAGKYGIRFIGPNCLGIVNTEIGLNTSGMSIDNRPGKLGLLSHSGTYVSQTADYLYKRGIRFSKAISLGNEANIDMVEALDFLGDDDETKAIALYMEGLTEGDRFIEVAKRVSKKKPILANYSGGSVAGARSSSSHTGAMSGPDHLFQGMFNQCGIIRVNSIEELYSHGWALATQPPLKGDRIAVITNSGGPGTSAANSCNMGGLDVPQFSEELQKDIRQHLFDHAPGKNPVDVTFTFDMNILAHKIPEQIVKHDEADGFIIHGTFTSGFLKAVYPNLKGVMDIPLDLLISQFKFDVSDAVAFPWKHGVPVLISSFFDREDNYTEAFHENDIPVFDCAEKAANAMLSFKKRKDIVDRVVASEIKIPEKNRNAEEIIETALSKGQSSLDEYEAKKLLASYGIPVVEERVVSSVKDAIETVSLMGYPVVLKGCRWDIQHKTGHGLIYLNVADEAGVKESFNKIVSIERDVPVLVQKMVFGSREAMAGMTIFSGFGPAIVFGAGGIYTEIIKDTSLRVAPLSIEDGYEMIDELKLSAMFNEFRGMPEVDKRMLSGIIQTLGFISILHPEIKEIDLNPIIFNGSEPVVVDALIVISE